MPVGQLDGGHGTFAVFGQRAHKIIGRVALITSSLRQFSGFGGTEVPADFFTLCFWELC